MSQLKKQSGKNVDIRTRLLATASSVALFAAAYASQPAMASDTDRPVVWLEVGGEFTQLKDDLQPYLPPFTLASPPLPFITVSPAEIEKRVTSSWDGNAELIFQPSGTDWALSLGVTYGRAARGASLRQQTAQRSPTVALLYRATQTTTSKNDESHEILDFRAGRDVGLGGFGNAGHSTLNIGVRYAQLNSKNNTNILYQPTNAKNTYHKFSAILDAERKFTGIGPALSWDATAGLAGNANDGGIFIDWGVNAAFLFGRQRVQGHHRTSETAVLYPQQRTPIYQTSVPMNRSRQVIIPNLGGFAGLSWRYPNAKVSVGYRADMFFGAIDGGIDTVKKENRAFFGPFASVSVGIGD